MTKNEFVDIGVFQRTHQRGSASTDRKRKYNTFKIKL